MEALKETILIVEDDAGLLELLNERLLELGCDVISVINAENAFNWLANNTPTLMLLDYSLPQMNGSEFIVELTTRNIAVPPFILATGQGDERIAVQMMKLGARDYILKDTNFLEFIPVVVSKVFKEIENENKLKFAEEEIIRIGKHYQAIIEKSPDGFVLLNQAGEFNYISPSALRMFGYDELEITSLHPNDLTHPEDLQMVLNNFGQLFQVPDFVPVIEYRFKHKNGDWIWIESTFSNLLDDVNVNGILINFRNISERKQTEKTLKIRETYLTAIIENLPGLIWLKDVNSRLLLTNSKFIQAFGKQKPEDLLGKTDLDFTPKEHAVKYLDDDKRVVSTKKPLQVEELILNHGTEKWFETFKMPIFDENMQVIGTTGYSQDITERKLSELELANKQKELAELFENAPVGYHELDSEGKIVRINQTELDLLGYTREELIGRNVWEISENKEIIHEIVLDKLSGKIQSSEPFERIFRKKDGSLIHVMIQDVYLYDEHGNISGIRSTLQDISNLKEAEEKIKKSEILHRNILETALSGFLMLDKFGNIKEVNQSYSNMSGFSIPELLSMKISDFETPDFNNHLDNILNLRLNRFESKHRRRDNTTYDVDISVQYKSTESDLIVLFVRDITERKQAEDAIKNSLSLLNATIESTADGILVVDLDGNATLFNHKFVEMWDIPDELLESRFDEQLLRYVLTQLLDPEIFLQKITALYKNPDITSVDEIQLSDGRTFVRYSIPQKIGEKIVGRVWSFHDVTERLKVEESLKASENRYKTFINATQDLVFIKDEKLKHIVVNKSLCEFYHKPENEILGKSDSEIIVNVILAENCRKSDELALMLNDIVITEEQIDNLIFETIKFPIEYQKGKIGVGGYIRDITDRKTAEQALLSSEELYRNLVERIPDGVYKSTPEGKFVEINPAMIKLLGYESKEELLAIDIKSDLYFNPEDREDLALDEFNEDTGIFQLKKKDGSPIWMEDHGWYTVNDKGEIIYHEGVLRDVTGRITAEQALARKMDEMTRFHNLTIDRELKMIELKKEINALLKAAGEEDRYVIVK